MNENAYRDIVLTGKEMAKKPLTLHKQAVGKDSSYGYPIADTNFLSKKWAKEAGAYYFDLTDFLEAVHLGDKQKIENYKEQLRTSNKIITSCLYLETDRKQEGLKYGPYYEALFTELKDVWKDSSQSKRNMVIPLILDFNDMNENPKTRMASHAAVACLNFNPKQDEADVIFLEQHAIKKGLLGPEYDYIDTPENYDYTEGLQLHQELWESSLKNDVGIKQINSFKNNTPICPRTKCCGVVATEVARRLLEADNPMENVKIGIRIDEKEVDSLHMRNQKLESSLKNQLSKTSNQVIPQLSKEME